jgi:hypothetical protein
LGKKLEKGKDKAPAGAPKQRRQCHSGGGIRGDEFELWQEGGWFHDVCNRVAGSQALRRDHTHKTTMNIMMAVVIGSA